MRSFHLAHQQQTQDERLPKRVMLSHKTQILKARWNQTAGPEHTHTFLPIYNLLLILLNWAKGGLGDKVTLLFCLSLNDVPCWIWRTIPLPSTLPLGAIPLSGYVWICPPGGCLFPFMSAQTRQPWEGALRGRWREAEDKGDWEVRTQ